MKSYTTLLTERTGPVHKITACRVSDRPQPGHFIPYLLFKNR